MLLHVPVLSLQYTFACQKLITISPKCFAPTYTRWVIPRPGSLAGINSYSSKSVHFPLHVSVHFFRWIQKHRFHYLVFTRNRVGFVFLISTRISFSSRIIHLCVFNLSSAMTPRLWPWPHGDRYIRNECVSGFRDVKVPWRTKTYYATKFFWNKDNITDKIVVHKLWMVQQLETKCM